MARCAELSSLGDKLVGPPFSLASLLGKLSLRHETGIVREFDKSAFEEFLGPDVAAALELPVNLPCPFRPRSVSGQLLEPLSQPFPFEGQSWIPAVNRVQGVQVRQRFNDSPVGLMHAGALQNRLEMDTPIFKERDEPFEVLLVRVLRERFAKQADLGVQIVLVFQSMVHVSDVRRQLLTLLFIDIKLESVK